MTNMTVHKALTAALALTLAATLMSATSFAKDGDNDRKGGKAQLKTDTFQFVAPKANRGGDAGTATAKFLPPKSGRDNGGSGPTPVFRLTPKATPAGSITTQFVAPKSDRGNAGNSGGPKIVEFVPPKAERGNSDSGVTTAKIIVPKAPRGDEPVLASAEQPAKPLLLAPASATPETVADQGAPAPAASTIQAEAVPTIVKTGTLLPASNNDVKLAYYRAAERYGYGSDSYASEDDYGSEDDYSYEVQSYDYGSNSYDEGCQ
jgi:hypothetical protein